MILNSSAQSRTVIQMEIIAHQYLTKLRIIAKIPENGQLDLTNNDLNIYSPGLVNWVYRKMHGDGKLNTIGFLKTFYQEVVVFTSELMKSIEAERAATNRNRKYVLLASLAEKIKESTVGVDNLIKTYRYYHKIISTLESIQQDIVENQLKSIIMFLPNQYKNLSLKDIENGQGDLVPIDDDKSSSRPIMIKSQTGLSEESSCGSHSDADSGDKLKKKSESL